MPTARQTQSQKGSQTKKTFSKLQTKTRNTNFTTSNPKKIFFSNITNQKLKFFILILFLNHTSIFCKSSFQKNSAFELRDQIPTQVKATPSIQADFQFDRTLTSLDNPTLYLRKHFQPERQLLKAQNQPTEEDFGSQVAIDHFEESGVQEGKIDKRTKLPILKHFHEDTYRVKLTLKLGMVYHFDLLNRINPVSMSSNFSSNIINAELPGIQGRNQQPHLYFPDRSFHPIKIETRHKDLFILESDLRTTGFFRFDKDKGFKEINWAIQDILRKSPNLGCSNYYIRNGMVFFICFNIKNHKIERVDIKYDYQLIIIDMFLNKLLYIAKFKDYHYTSPQIFVNEEPLKSGEYLIFLFNKTQPSDLKAHFVSNSRLSVIHIQIDKKKEIFDMKNLINRDLEELIFKKISDSVTFLKMNYHNSGTMDLLIRRKFSDYSIKKQLFKCDIHFNPKALSELSLINCYQSIEANIVRYSFYKDNIVYVDENNLIFYCHPHDPKKRKELKKKGINPGKIKYDCSQGSLGLGWEFIHFEIFKKTALTIFKVSPQKFLAFIFYYDTKMFTWFAYSPVKVRARHLVVVEEEGHSQLLKIHEKGLSIFRLDFEPFFKLDQSHLRFLEHKLLYLDGHPFYNVKMTYWDGDSILDQFNGKEVTTIVNKKTGFYFARLGYSGNNINFSEHGEHKIYNFRKMTFDMSQTDEYYFYLKDSEKILSDEEKSTRILMYSDYDKNFVLFFKEFMVIHKIDLEMLKDTISLKKPKRVDFKEGFKLDLENISSMDTKGDLILFFLKNPFELTGFDLVRDKYVVFSTPKDFNDPNVKNCMLNVILIVCIFHNPEKNMDYLRVYNIKAREVVPYTIANATLQSKFEEMMDLEFEGNLPSSLEIISFDTDVYKNHNMFVFLALEYQGTNRYSGFEFLIANSSQSSKNNNMDVVTWFDVKYLRTHPNVGKNSEIFFYGNVYLVKQARPKFNLFFINRYTEMEYEYLETNEILYQKNYPYARIFTIIYRHLEDEQIYFAVYQISNQIEKTFIRNEHFPEYNPQVKIDYIMISPTIIVIIFYDSFTGEILKTYTFFVRGPFIMSKSFKDIIIDHDRYSLNVSEDKRVHYSYYFTKQKPEILIFEDQTDKFSFKLHDYLDIRGNVIDIDWVQDPTQDNSKKKLIPIEGITLKKTKIVQKNSTLKNYITEQKFSSNGYFFAVNTTGRNTFSIYRPNSMIKMSEITFPIPPGTNCQQVTISNHNIFCFYNLGYKSYVMVRNFKNLEVAPIVVHAYTIGVNYDVVFDSDEAAFLIYLHRTKTSVEILKINKKKETSQKTILSAKDFSEMSLFMNGVTFFYNRDDKNLVVIGLNVITNSLVLYSGFFDEKTLELNPIKTIKNKINMDTVGNNLFELRCEEQMKNYVFNCLLIGKDYMSEIRISKDFNAEISPFKWDVKLLYRYFNVLYYEYIERKNRIQFRFSEDNLFLVYYHKDWSGIINYRRFESPYIHDYYNFKDNDSGIHRPLTSVISSDGKKIQILGLDKDDNDFLVSIYKSKVIKIKLKKPNLFINTTQTLRVTFWNERQIDINFKFANASDLEEEKNNWSMMLLYGLKGLLMFTSMAICFALFYLFKLLKDGGHGVLEQQPDYQKQETMRDNLTFTKMYSRKKTAKEKGMDDDLSGDGSNIDVDIPEDIARLRNNLDHLKRTRQVKSSRIENMFSGRTLRPAHL